MRRLIRFALWGLALAVVAAGAGVAYLMTAFPDVPPAEAVTIEATPERLARGEYLARHVTGCVFCHAQRDWTRYGAPVTPGTEGAGGEFFGEPGTALQLWAPNITPARLREWTDGEIIRAMTTGVSRDGTALFPIMPYLKYGGLAREDVAAVVAYIRSLPARSHETRSRELGFPLPLIVRTIPQPAALRDAIPPATDRVAYGEYLVNAAACADCHTPQDDQGQPLPGMDFAGGFELWLEGGGRQKVANITPDATTGIGSWTEEQFVDKFKSFEGVEPRTLVGAERLENTHMPWLAYSGMTREDLSAIYAYLRTVKPVVNRIK
ncbi:MAG: c-type cytochrome [Acidobacteriota bacterium]